VYMIRTGNDGLLKTEVRVGGGLIPIQLDEDMETTEWQVYMGDEPTSKRFQMGAATPNIRGEMRKVVQGLLGSEAGEPGTGSLAPIPPSIVPVPMDPPPAETPPPSTPELDAITTEINLLQQLSIQNIVEIGRRLMDAKGMVGHGNWLAYLNIRLKMDARQAQNFMAVSRDFGSNTNLVSHLTLKKVLMLLAADKEDRPQLAAVIGDMKQSDAQKTVDAAVRARREAEERARKAEAGQAESNRQVEDLVAEVVMLKSRPAPPPPEPEKIPVDSPELLERLAQAEREKDEAVRLSATVAAENARLLAQVQGEQQAKIKREQEDKKAERLAERTRKNDHAWDDTGLNPNGGRTLMDALDPLYKPIAHALAEVLILKRTGAGGFCQIEPIERIVPDLRQLADAITEILRIRNNRPIMADFKEVPENVHSS
jgi:hypothetical protein